MLKDRPFPITNEDIIELKKDSEKEIFNIIFRIPKLDEFIANKGDLFPKERICR